ncbi:hypothetical protein JCM33374_g6247 [Metschnikowia sp. JCM 33374]|nr:hypothetical protein JCM33374_g6247 [Metschnikowia sp. JCM 33374]
MSQDSDIVFKSDQGADLDNPLRAIIVVNSSDAPEGEMEERMLDGIQTFDEVDAFFDLFDFKVAYPNEEHIKYEVGSDGLVVFVVDSLKLKSTVLEFLDEFVTEEDGGKGEAKQQQSDETDEDGGRNKRSKTSGP